MLALTDSAIPAEKDFAAVAENLKNFDFMRYAMILVLFVSCLVAMKILLKLLDKTLDRLKVEHSLHHFIKSVSRVLMWLVTIVIVAGYIGVPVTSLVTILGVIGLAISLAIQGTLSNLAGGIMVLLSKPFSGGDYIEVGTVGGTVSEIGMVYTKIKTFDNKIIYVPNGQISGEKITNYTQEKIRRVDLKFCTAYEETPPQVKACILNVIGVHPKALFTPEPFVGVNAYKENSVEYAVRVWCATDDYWALYYDLLEQVKAAFDEEGIAMTYNHLNVHMVGKNL